MTSESIDQVSIRLENASIHNVEQLVLQDINLSIPKGSFTYLIGKTGSGKSSLLKTLYAAQPLKQGEGEVVGYNLGKLTFNTIPLLRRRLGIVFQDFNLIDDMTASENLSFILDSIGWKRKPAIAERVNESLESVGLFSVNHKYPHQLSGGEQQRLVLARAIVNRPELIIADEPTGNLDPETTDEIMLLLRAINQNSNTTILFATHDYSLLAKYPNRILECTDGKVLERLDIPIF